MHNDELSLQTTQSLLINWKIPIFFHLSKHNACWLLSPEFQFVGDSFHLRLFHQGEEFGIVLENATNTVPAEDVLFEIGLKSRTGEEIQIDRRMGSRKVIYLFPRWEVENDRETFYSDGNITVFCFIRLGEPSRAENPEHGEAQIQDRSVVLNFPSHISFELYGELSFESPQSLHVIWKIPNFFVLTQQSEYSGKSPEFSFGDDRFCLLLFPSGGSDQKRIGFKLVKVSDSLPKTDVSYEVGLMSSTGKEIVIHRNKPTGHLMLAQPVPSREQFLLHREFFISRVYILEGQRHSIFPDDILTVSCCLRLKEPNSSGDGTSDEEDQQERFAGITKLQSDYRELLEKGLESDACLVVGGKEFPAHKIILRARSSIFDAMFCHEMAEKESGRVVIDDLDLENIGDFLEYLYTGVVGSGLSVNNVFGLYKGAHKYDVPTLKSECVAHMRRNMSGDFFCDAITLAVLYKEQDLFQKAMKFFQRNMARIIVTGKWQQFSIENGATTNELLINAITLKNQ